MTYYKFRNESNYSHMNIFSRVRCYLHCSVLKSRDFYEMIHNLTDPNNQLCISTRRMILHSPTLEK